MNNNYFIVLALCFYLSVNYAQETNKNITNNKYEWDFLIFTQHWPISVCKEWQQENNTHSCQFPKKQQSWSIHGIWPTKNGTLGPNFCNNSWHFDPEMIKPIESMLLDLWVDVENGTSEYSFWVHEWTKHGTCAAVLESLNSEYKYFKQGIDWMPIYDISQSLGQHNILPSDDKMYTATEIQKAILDTWHVNPNIQCRYEKGRQYLFEIQLCFNKNLKLVDCSGLHNKLLTNCKTATGVLYPKSTHPVQARSDIVNYAQETNKNITNNKYEWDFLIFTQHWPISVCKEWQQENNTHSCQFPKKQQSWSIHGIWPTKNGTLGPNFCNNSWHFDPEMIKPIESMLLDLWVDVENGTSEYSFWVHEWTKHGTCAAVLESLNSEYKYFKQGIDWMPIYDISQSLGQHNILPSDDKMYTATEIQKAILDTWHVNPNIQCRYEKGRQYLFEIQLCFNKNLKLVDCSGLHNKLLTNCKTATGVLYPKSTHPVQARSDIVNYAQETNKNITNNKYEWDFLIFTQHWPISVCKEWQQENNTHSCQFPKKQQSWSIHGIWPTKNGTLGPNFCNNSWHFDPEMIKPIESMLLDLWVDVENGTSEYSFWVHEWTKHGTCAAVLESLNSEYKYFKQGIDWMPIYDISQSLGQHNILPSDDKMYTATEIQKAILDTWHVNPNIQCRYEKGRQYLFEIQLCFNKNLKLVDCSGLHNKLLTNCKTATGVLYPKSTHPVQARSDIVNYAQETNKNITNNKYEWDFLIFTQHWPISVCKEWQQENNTHSCQFPKKQQSWSIHGIWPTKNGTLGPNFCNNSWHFDPEMIKPIESMLLDLWVDVENGTSEYSFWVHEWTKHGTCAAVLESLNSEYKYFKQGIDWMPIYDISQSLGQHNILPSDDKMYTATEIQKAILDTWHVNPNIQCRYEKGRQYLFEIQLCFNKNLKLVDCSGLHNKLLTNCKTATGVLYPKSTHPVQARSDILIYPEELEYNVNKEVNQWDFLIFTQHWPTTVCREWKREDHTHTCKFPEEEQSWTIHGIWPTKVGTMGPEFCNNSWHFDPDQIKPIEPTLLDLWIDVENTTSEYSLWVHEWTKHGTCAAVLESLNSEYKYFKQGIDWMTYDISWALAKHDIVPSDDDSYALVEVQKAILNAWQVNPQIECRFEKQIQYIFEIRLCFTKDLVLMDCYGKHDGLVTNCNAAKEVVYPKSTFVEPPPSDLYVELYKLVMFLRWFTL